MAVVRQAMRVTYHHGVSSICLSEVLPMLVVLHTIRLHFPSKVPNLHKGWVRFGPRWQDVARHWIHSVKQGHWHPRGQHGDRPAKLEKRCHVARRLHVEWPVVGLRQLQVDSSYHAHGLRRSDRFVSRVGGQPGLGCHLTACSGIAQAAR